MGIKIDWEKCAVTAMPNYSEFECLQPGIPRVTKTGKTFPICTGHWVDAQWVIDENGDRHGLVK